MGLLSDLERLLVPAYRSRGFDPVPVDALPPSVELMPCEKPMSTRTRYLGPDAKLVRTGRRTLAFTAEHLLHLADPVAARERDAGRLGPRETASLRDTLDGEPLHVSVAPGLRARVMSVTSGGERWTIRHRGQRMTLHRGGRRVVGEDGTPANDATWVDNAIWQAFFDSGRDEVGISPLRRLGPGGLLRDSDWDLGLATRRRHWPARAR